MQQNISLKKPILLWSLSSLFFAYQFILRLSAGILREEIIQKFAMDTIAFGTLAGYYYLGYAGMQIPIGIMLDRLNFKIVTFGSILAVSLGTVTFTAAPDWQWLLVGRFLIGAGSAVGFLAIAKITKSYFPAKHHSFLLGLSFTVGLIGAVFGVAPMNLLFERFGFNNTFNGLALTGLLIGLSIVLINTDDLKHYDNQKTKPAISASDILKLLCNPTILLIGISGGLMVGTLEGFADVWAIPLFGQIYHMSETDSTLIASFLYIGMCFGGPILALSAEYFKSINFMIFLTGACTILIFIILFYCPSLSFLYSSTLMFLLGIFCCYQVLVFTLTSNIVSKSSAGLAIALVNCINMSFGHFFHKIMSILISNNWDGRLNDIGAPIYSREDFIVSLSVVPICCAIGMIGFLHLSFRMRRDPKRVKIQVINN